MSRLLDAARAYGRAFERLTPTTLSDLAALWTDDVLFRDPFNEIRGISASLAVYRHMFETLDDPRFVVLDVTASETAAYLKWRMTFRSKGRLDTWTIEGVSELAVADDGRVRSHFDHWDAASQLYEKMPVLGVLMRWLKGRLKAPSV